MEAQTFTSNMNQSGPPEPPGPFHHSGFILDSFFPCGGFGSSWINEALWTQPAHLGVHTVAPYSLVFFHLFLSAYCHHVRSCLLTYVLLFYLFCRLCIFFLSSLSYLTHQFELLLARSLALSLPFEGIFIFWYIYSKLYLLSNVKNLGFYLDTDLF